MLEVNALYGDSALEQPILIRPSRLDDSQLEGYDLVGTLIALEFKAVEITSSLWVEQVAWTQAAQLARVWCEHNDASDWQTFVARSLARSLQAHPDLLAYIAYQSKAEVSMMVISSGGCCGWWAGTDDVARALFARGASDLGQLEVTVPIERRSVFEGTQTARFEIFIADNLDHRPLGVSR